MPEVQIVHTEEDRQKAYALRYKVFVEEQKVPEDMELDEYDATAIHAILKDGDKTIGTGRLIIEDELGHIGRIAIDPDYRRRNLGTQIMEKLEEEAKARNLKEIYLHAQTYAKRFYQQLGYQSRGQVFDEAGIEHIEMYKLLQQ